MGPLQNTLTVSEAYNDFSPWVRALDLLQTFLHLHAPIEQTGQITYHRGATVTLIT